MSDNNRYNRSPFNIFIKDHGKSKDETILKWLKLSDYSEIPYEEDPACQFSFFIVRMGEWTHIYDNYFYHLWHCLKFNDKENKTEYFNHMGKKFELFAFTIGDTDDSLEIFYFKDKRLLRKYIYEENHRGEVTRLIDIGKKLQPEIIFKEDRYQIDYGYKIAKSLNIEINHNTFSVKLFANTDLTEKSWYQKYKN